MSISDTCFLGLIVAELMSFPKMLGWTPARGLIYVSDDFIKRRVLRNRCVACARQWTKWLTIISFLYYCKGARSVCPF